MASRWQFHGAGGWQDFYQEQHEGIHAAWLGGRPSFLCSVAGHDYRIDLRRMVQVNVSTRTEREIRPPAWATAELQVSAFERAPRKSAASGSRQSVAAEATELLHGSEGKDPVCELRLVALGAAIPRAVETATSLEAADAGQVVKVHTDIASTGDGVKADKVARISIHLRSCEAVAQIRRQRWDRLTAAMGSQSPAAAQMPKLNLLRLMKEFRRMEQALHAAAVAASASPASPSSSTAVVPTAVGGVVQCEPVEDSLLEWDVAMCFPEGSDLHRGLVELAASAGEAPASAGRLLLRARFPADFPATPPEIWVRRPRLVHKTAPVSFGGRLCCHLLSSAGWEPATAMTTVFQEVQSALLETGTEVDMAVPVIRSYLTPKLPPLERLRTDAYDTANSFARKGIKVMSPETAMPFLGDVDRIEATDKIALPIEYLEEICRRRALDTPAMFEVKTRLGRKRHCAVFDWVDGLPTEHAILPRWVMEDLCVEDWEQVQVRGVKLELVSFVKVQPHSADFYEAAGAAGMDIKELLTESLSCLSGLTEDTCVPIRIGDATYNMQVVELRPQGAVRIIDSDVEEHFEFQVDFEPAPDFHDEAAMKARQDRLLADHRAQQERQESVRKAHEERRNEALRKRYVSALNRAKEAAGADDGREGSVEVPLQLPDGSQINGKFREGAPIAALAAMALASAWAEASLPLGVQLRERAPPRRLLTEGMAIDKAMHRSIVIVQQQVLDGGEDDEALLQEAAAQDAAKTAGATDAGAVRVSETPLQPPPMIPLMRNVSQLQRRTLEAFEAQAFMRAGLEPEEADRRARNGEVAPPPCAARLSLPKNRPGDASRDQPRRPQLHRTVSQEQRRDKQVEEVMNIVGLTRSEAEAALAEHDWNTEIAINALFDAFHAD